MLHVAGHCWPLERWEGGCWILQAALINIGNIVVIAASARALPWLSRLSASRQAARRGDSRPTAILPLLLPLNGHVNI